MTNLNVRMVVNIKRVLEHWVGSINDNQKIILVNIDVNKDY